jgi:glycosyltransferase involved in cell wall biosynthesis
MKLILSHPTANNNSRAVAYKLLHENMLYQFYTSIASFHGGLLDKIQHIPILSEIQRRNFEIELKPYTTLWPWVEIGRILSQKAGVKHLTRNEFGYFSVDAAYKGLDKKVASGLKEAVENGVNGIYAYEDGALATFTRAQELNLKCIYDLPIAYWETSRKLMTDEATRLPAWAETLGGGILNSEAKLKRKTQELQLADLVVVPSQFVMDSLPVWAKDKKVVMAPFGTPAINNVSLITDRKTPGTSKLRVLFAGSMSQRKGLGDLFSAVKLLNSPNIELVVMGELLAPIEFYRKEYNNFTYEPVRPNYKVLELMQTCDVFCLPSIVEGRALVMQEAMSQGLPLIITPNTGGEDLVIEGETGFVVPIRSPEAIAEKLEWFIKNRSHIPTMSNMVKLHAQKYTWEKYGNQIVNAINELI